MSITAADIVDLTKAVTKEWTKQRKAEERDSRAKNRRENMYSDRVNFTDVAHEILQAGYEHASGNGMYTVDNRQFYYACRDAFREQAGREIDADYFTQTLLVKYMNQHPEETAHWKITASPRGTLTIPNTDFDARIPCGTIAIEEHLAKACQSVDPFDVNAKISVEWPSLAEGQRYQAVMYIEKEGFDPQIHEARLMERFDLAIMSCKGQSVVAARHFSDRVCRVNGGVPLFVAHDFDPSGFSICQRLTSVSDYAIANDLVKYEFKNYINVIDLGLRMEDVEKYDLKSERFNFRGFPDDIDATDEEKAFFRSGRRVELNAFTAPQFIEWLEGKLFEHLPAKFVPADDILESAYKRALAIAHMNAAIDKARDEAIEKARSAKVLKGLRRELEKSKKPWDKAIYALAKKQSFIEECEMTNFYFFVVVTDIDETWDVIAGIMLTPADWC